jgi:hypothetical protein
MKRWKMFLSLHIGIGINSTDDELNANPNMQGHASTSSG